jgi:hypothetical protein
MEVQPNRLFVDEEFKSLERRDTVVNGLPEGLFALVDDVASAQLVLIEDQKSKAAWQGQCGGI